MGKATTTGFAYEVFDLTYLDGFSLTQTPLKHRKELPKKWVGSNSHGVIRYSEHINEAKTRFQTGLRKTPLRNRDLNRHLPKFAIPPFKGYWPSWKSALPKN